MAPRTPRPVTSALDAVTRLLALAAEGASSQAVRQALAREARTALDVRGVLLLQVSLTDRLGELLVSEPSGGDAGDPLAVDSLDALRELVDRRSSVVRAGAAQAQRLSRLAGIDVDAGVALIVPMRSRDVLEHVLVLLDDGTRTFADEEVEIATAFASAAAASLAQLRITQEHGERIAQQSALARAAKALNESLDIGHTLTAICREAQSVLDGDCAVVYLGDAASGLRMEAVHDFPPESIGYHIDPGQGLSGKVVQLDRSMLTNDYQRVASPAADSPFHDVKACLAVPIHWDGRLRGVLSVGYRRPMRLEGDRLRLLETFAELAATALRNARAHAGLALQARTDGLTGCLNHAALQEHLRREVERSERTGHPLAFVLIDLDHFKQVNEEHGHLVGDEVLRRVGHALLQGLRPYDAVARYGGDEFAIVAPDTQEHEAAEIASRAIERLSRAIDDIGGHRGASLATAGVAAWRPGLTAPELIATADRALLGGKRSVRRGTVLPASALPAALPEPGATGGDPRRPEPGSGLAIGPPSITGRPRQPPGPPVRDADDEQTDRLRKRTRQLALANQLGTRLAAMNDADQILEAAVEELHHAFGYWLCAVIRIRDDGFVESTAARGAAFEELGQQRWTQPRSAGIIGRCLRERRPIVVGDVYAEPGYEHTELTAAVKSELVVPLWIGDQLWGAINIEEIRLHAFDEDDARLVQTVADQVGSALRSALLYERLERAYLGTAEALAAALEAKDSYTAHHARSIVEHTQRVGMALGMDDEQLRALRYGAIFHDIGKIFVPETILNKRGPLTPDERRVIEQHTVVGEQILAPVEFLADVLPLVRHEHERWDGAGYPDGLAGEAIPLGARIILACDAYDAMTTDRPYRVAMAHADAVDELRRHAGTQLDPRVVDALLAVLGAEPGTAERDALRATEQHLTR